jgi:chromate transporter
MPNSNFSFLKNVLLHSVTAYGGPQAHFAMMMKTFVKQKNYITETELLEYNALCQLLPGASSTQIITLVGYKRGGLPLAILTLMVWVLPASIFMGAISFLLHMIDKRDIETDLFKFIAPMAVGFLLFSCIKTFSLVIKNGVSWIIMILAAAITYFFFQSPFVFPALIVAGGITTNITNKRKPEIIAERRKIQWNNLWLFIAIFVVAGVLSETARRQNWEYRKPINLFESNYRMGSLVFGGGQVLMPMMMEQYSIRPEAVRHRNPDVIQIDKADMYTGMGLVRAMPGPVFSIASFTGGMALRDMGDTRFERGSMQAIGCAIATIGIFLPSFLLVLFFFPIWNNLKKYTVIHRSLEGINAAVLGIMIGSTFYMMKDISITDANVLSVLNLGVIVGTSLLLLFSRIPAPVIVLICLGLGYWWI